MKASRLQLNGQKHKLSGWVLVDDFGALMCRHSVYSCKYHWHWLWFGSDNCAESIVSSRMESTRTLVKAYISSHLQCCNSLLPVCHYCSGCRQFKVQLCMSHRGRCWCTHYPITLLAPLAIILLVFLIHSSARCQPAKHLYVLYNCHLVSNSQTKSSLCRHQDACFLKDEYSVWWHLQHPALRVLGQSFRKGLKSHLFSLVWSGDWDLRA